MKEGGRRIKQLLDDLRNERRYQELKERDQKRWKRQFLSDGLKDKIQVIFHKFKDLIRISMLNNNNNNIISISSNRPNGLLRPPAIYSPDGQPTDRFPLKMQWSMHLIFIRSIRVYCKQFCLQSGRYSDNNNSNTDNNNNTDDNNEGDNNNKNKKIKSVAYSPQGGHTGQLDFCN